MRYLRYYSCYTFFAKTSSVVKSVTELDVDLPRVVKVESSEGQTVVEEDTAIRYIQGAQRDPVLLAETLSERNIKGSVLRKITARILRVGVSVGEARAIVNIGRSERVARQACIET